MGEKKTIRTPGVQAIWNIWRLSGLTQEAVAKAGKIHRGRCSEFLNGKRRLTAPNLNKLLIALKVLPNVRRRINRLLAREQGWFI